MQLKFPDLIEVKGGALGYSSRCEALSGAEVEIAGFVAESHDGSAQLLVAEPGGCPDCSPEPMAAIMLPGFSIDADGKPVKLRGTLSFGFQMDAAGNASFLRLEGARIATGLPV